MRYLIVNADDFGFSRGVNRWILEAHDRGIVTSASVLRAAERKDIRLCSFVDVALPLVAESAS